MIDWVTNPAIAVSYEGVAIGRNGGITDAAERNLKIVGAHGVDGTHLQPEAGPATMVIA
jgi:hypothetical protein